MSKRTTGQRSAAAPLYAGVKTIEQWNDWMRARDRYQWNEQE